MAGRPHKAYIEAVWDAVFAGAVDYTMLVKLYGAVDNGESAHRRHPGECRGTARIIGTGPVQKAAEGGRVGVIPIVVL